MPLTFIAKDPNTNGENCPTVWVDPETEAVVRLPARMVAAIREACNVAEGSAVR